MYAYQGGDARAFDVLYSRWRGPLYRYFARQCADPDALFQDTFMRVIASAPRYSPTAPFPAWLFTIAHHRLVDHWRQSGRVIIDSLSNDDDDGAVIADVPAPAHWQPEARAEAADLGRHLLEALGTLPEAQRETFLLAEEAEMSYEAIAEVTGVPRETVKSRLRYALAKLRAALEPMR